ncbi:hypothetical protein AAVH_36640 [Aphelenchoides avenae]|nr:hypothetical protein AAVH_36640 [Aphelenchus avenae]
MPALGRVLSIAVILSVASLTLSLTCWKNGNKKEICPSDIKFCASADIPIIGKQKGCDHERNCKMDGPIRREGITAYCCSADLCDS